MGSASGQISLDYDNSGTRAAKSDIQDLISAVGKDTLLLRIAADQTRLKSDLNEAQAELRRLTSQPAEVQVQAEIAAAQANINRIQTELRSLNSMDAEVRVTADTGPAERDMEGFKGKTKAIGAGIGLGLSAAIASSVSIEDANAKLEAQLGLTTEEANRAGKLAGELYSNGFGESIDQVNQSLVGIQTNIGELSSFTDSELKTMSEAALGLAQTFDVDVNDATRAAGQLMKTGLAVDGKQAFDIITQGFQNGANASDDFLDTLVEYAGQFQKLGVDGPTATGLISQGLKAGARDADLVADAIKEFSIRAVDGSKSSAEAFAGLGLSAEDMTAKFAQGGTVARDSLQEVFEKLRAVEDPALRAQIAVGLFGTQAEDLGAALYALDPNQAISGMENLEGATDRMNKTLAETAGAKIEGAKRGFQALVASLVSMDGPVGDVTAGLAGLGPEVLTAGAAMITMGAVAGPAILSAAAALWGLIAPAAAAGAAAAASAAVTIASWIAAAAVAVAQAAIMAAAWLLANPIVLIIAALVAIVAVIIMYWDEIVAFLAGVWQWISDTAIAVWTAITTFLAGIWQAVSDAWMVVWNAIVAFISPIWEVIKTIIITAWEVIVNIFRYAAAILLAIFFTIWNPIQALIMFIWNGIVAFLTMVWEGIVSLATTVWTAITTAITAAVQAVSDFVMPIWQAIVDFLTAAWDTISSAASTVWNAVSDVIRSVMDAIMGVITAVWGAIWGFLEPIWNTMQSVASSVWEAISSVISSVMNAINGVITSVWNGISSFFSGIWSTITGIFSSAGASIMGALNNLWNTIRNLAGTALGLLVDAGRNIVMGLWNGIVSLGGWLWDQIMGWIRSVVPGPILQFLGIASPSKWMRDKVGEQIPAGLAIGIEGAAGVAERAAEELANRVGTAATSAANMGNLAAATQTNAAGLPVVSAVNAATATEAAMNTSSRALNLGQLILNVTGNLDPTNPVQWRGAIEQIREEILNVELSYN